jgi:hypothetical protein
MTIKGNSELLMMEAFPRPLQGNKRGWTEGKWQEKKFI